MPAAVAVPAIAAVVGGGIKYAGDRSAAGAQERSSREALDYAKENEARRRQEYDAQQAAYKQAYENWYRSQAPYRAASAGAGEYFGLHRTPNAPIPMAEAAGSVSPPLTLGAMAGMPPGPDAGAMAAPPQAAPGMAQGQPMGATLGNLADWGNWGNYGVRR